MKLVFICRKFDNVAGGMERMCVAIMNAMVEYGHDVALITWDHDNAQSYYKVSSSINWFKLNIGNPETKADLRMRFKRIFKARQFIKDFDADVIIGFQSGGFVFGYACSLFLGIPCVAAERVSPDTWRHVRTRLKDRLLDTYSLLLANKITVQLESYARHYPKLFQKKIIVIPNPVYEIEKYELEKEKVILNVGRLCPQKNQMFLIEAFQYVHDKYPDWKLVILGDGIDEKVLKKLINKLDLQSHVFLMGSVKNVHEWYRRASIFAFPSIFEGFPNALSEALAAGLPSVGFKETFGVNELIKHEKNGLLTSECHKEFSNALIALIDNEELRNTMSIEAGKITDEYRPEKIFKEWHMFFEDASK